MSQGVAVADALCPDPVGGESPSSDQASGFRTQEEEDEAAR